MEIALEGAAIADRAGSIRHVGVSMRLLQAWIALEGQRWEEARRLSVAERPLIEGPGCTANALQMSSALRRGRRPRSGRIRSTPLSDLERLRDWYRRDRLVLDWFWKSATAQVLRRARAAAAGISRPRPSRPRAPRKRLTRTPERTWRGRAHVIAAQVALERQRFC